MIRGSMDPVHERRSMDPVHSLMDPVHGPGPRRGSMDHGSMFCTFPTKSTTRKKENLKNDHGIVRFRLNIDVRKDK